MQHFNKYGIAALMFFLGTALPAVAQDEVQEEVTEVSAREIKKIKPAIANTNITSIIVKPFLLSPFFIFLLIFIIVYFSKNTSDMIK